MSAPNDTPSLVQSDDDYRVSVALDIQGLTKSFGGNQVLHGIDLQVYEGEFVTLLGPSGSGKTTLLRIIAGFERADGGRILLRGRNISRLTPAERGLGMVFQQYALFPHMTVADNIGYGLKMRGWPPAQRARRIAQMLDLVNLRGYGDRYPRQLSGGQQQRVALARALAYDPQILLMDEPLGALDRSLRLQMAEEIRRIHRELRPTIIYVTHDQQEALALSDRVAIMGSGRIVGFDKPNVLYERPNCAFVARFFANANLIPGEVVERLGADRAIIECAGSRCRVAVQGEKREVFVAVRPRSLRRGEGVDGLTIRGRVLETLLLGDDREITLDVPSIGRVTATMDARESIDLDHGQEVTLFVPQDELTVVPRD